MDLCGRMNHKQLYLSMDNETICPNKCLNGYMLVHNRIDVCVRMLLGLQNTFIAQLLIPLTFFLSLSDS